MSTITIPPEVRELAPYMTNSSDGREGINWRGTCVLNSACATGNLAFVQKICAIVTLDPHTRQIAIISCGSNGTVAQYLRDEERGTNS